MLHTDIAPEVLAPTRLGAWVDAVTFVLRIANKEKSIMASMLKLVSFFLYLIYYDHSFFGRGFVINHLAMT